MTTKTKTNNIFEDDALYLLDVSSFIFRAYYSVGYLSMSDGTPTGAVFGVANMLVSLFNDHKPTHLTVAMDSKTPTFRKEIYPEYKANRPPPPDDLKVQFPFVTELLEAFELNTLQCDGFEADDIIATVVKKAREQNMKVVIVSADKDLMQLVNDDVVMFDTMKNKVWDVAAVEEKFGVPPRLLGDLLALSGDSSDNIPGIPRVGPKTAAPLLMQFDGLENLLENAGKLKTKAQQKRFMDHAEDARLSKKLVTLNDQVPVDVNIADAVYGSPRLESLGPVLDKFELTKLKVRLFGKTAPTHEQPKCTYETIDDIDQLKSIAADIKAAGRFAIDLETTSINAISAQIVGVALAWKPLHGIYVPVAHAKGKTIALEKVLKIIGPLLEDPNIGVIAQNCKYEDTVFRSVGIRIAGFTMDPMLAAYVLRPETRENNLDALADRYLKRTTISYDEVTGQKGSKKGQTSLFSDVAVDQATDYAGEDAEVALALAEALTEPIEKAKMENLLHELELPTAGVLCGMEMAGVSIDTDYLKKLSDTFGAKLLELEKQAHFLADEEFNLSSPKQLQEILFTKLALPTQKKTKTGYSTNSEVLETLASHHELPKVLLEHRMLSKLKNGYLDALPKLVNPKTNRIHTSFNQTITVTGRLSSSNPNLQNIPIRTEQGREIRRAFIAKEGHVLLSADYSQVELRVLAHLSNDPVLIEAFQNGDDIHEKTARAVFGYDDDAPVSKEDRSKAKAINFGVIYGKTEYSLGKELNIPRKEARSFIEGYFALYQGVSSYMDALVEQAKEQKAVFTLLGRKRELRDITARNYNVRQHAERMARNAPIQGTAADLMKLAMLAVDQKLTEENLQSKMILTVHDEIVLEVPTKEIDQVTQLVKTQMENAMNLSVPLVVDVGKGANWAEAH